MVNKYKGECKCGATIVLGVTNATLDEKYVMCEKCGIMPVKVEKDN